MTTEERPNNHQERYDARRPTHGLRIATAITMIGGSSYIALLASLVRSIIVMRLIGPRGRGIQRLVGLLKGYLSTLTIAFRHGASKELPMAVGAHDVRRAAEVEDAVFLSVTALSTVAALGLVLYAIVFSAADWDTRVALCAGGGLLLAEDMAALYWVVLRSWSRFSILAIGELVRTVAQFVLMVGGAWLMGVTGVMLGWLAGGMIVLLYLDRAARIRTNWRVIWPHLWRLGLVGLPVALISFSDVLLRSIDGTVLWRFYGEEQFGLYSVAMQMAAYLYTIPQAAGFVIWPKVLESYGGAETPRRRRRRVILPTIGLAALMPVIGGVAFLMLPSAINIVVPKFADSVPPAQVLSMGATFLALPLSTNAALVANDREGAVIATKLAGALVAGGGTWYFVHGGSAMTAVALAACSGYALAAVLSLIVQLRSFYPTTGRLAREVLLVLAPTAWAAGALWATHAISAQLGMVPVHLLDGALSSIIFLILSIPCVIWADRQTGAVREITSAIRNRFRT